jgi:hypothetical protein
MSTTIAGFPFWRIEFDRDGHLVGTTLAARLEQGIEAGQLTDLLVFSHGWNNDHQTAERLYSAFFAELRPLLDDPRIAKARTARIGTLGVFWPSILWPDEVPADLAGGADAGGAAAFGHAAAEPSEEVPLDDLKKIFDESEHDLLDELSRMVTERDASKESLRAFKEKLDDLVAASAAGDSEDELERTGLVADSADFEDVFDALADAEPAPESEGGAAGLGDQFGKLWAGAKGALRVATYGRMKERAGVVGRTGLGPLLSRIAAIAPEMHIHLIGHSFGARLVSYALSGLTPVAAKKSWPVKSLLLLQGAFSHFAFADSLPHDPARKGALCGMAARVDGPLITTYSELDTAVGRAYPLASFVTRQDAAKAGEVASRWGAMGNDGAQAVDATEAPLGAVEASYDFKAGKWINLDGNHIIKTGGFPSGAHSDIIHPEIAWVTLAAAKIV